MDLLLKISNFYRTRIVRDIPEPTRYSSIVMGSSTFLPKGFNLRSTRTKLPKSYKAHLSNSVDLCASSHSSNAGPWLPYHTDAGLSLSRPAVAVPDPRPTITRMSLISVFLSSHDVRPHDILALLSIGNFGACLIVAGSCRITQRKEYTVMCRV